MERVGVTSSNIRSIGYDEQSETLEVEFLSGGVYQYFSVPKATHQAFMAASSKGKYHARSIKGVFSYQAV